MDSKELLRLAKEYEEKDDLDRAYLCYLEAAMTEDDGEAVYVLAEKYLNGEIVALDVDKASHYFELAYERGYDIQPEFFVTIGGHYDKKGNPKTAMWWYKKALDSGVNYANACIGELYYLGEGVDKDCKKAFELFKKVEDQSLPYYYLGLMYESGDYVQQDLVKAAEYYSKIVNDMPILRDCGDYFYGLAIQRLDKLEKTSPNA